MNIRTLNIITNKHKLRKLIPMGIISRLNIKHFPSSWLNEPKYQTFPYPVPTMARAKWQQLTRFAPKPSNEGLLERQLGRNSILDTFPEMNSTVASRITLLNETGHCGEPCKYASGNHIRMWNARGFYLRYK